MSSASSGARRLDLGSILLEKTRLLPEQLEEAVSRQAETNVPLAEVLINGDFLRSDEVLSGLAELLGLDFQNEIDLDAADSEIAAMIPISFAKQHQMLPLGRTTDNRLSVATARPFDTTSLDDLRLVYGVEELDLCVVPEAAVVTAINRIFDFNSGATDELAEAAEDDLDALATEISHEPQDLLDATDDAPIIRLVNSLLQHAVKERASDIHIEPFERDIRVRFRMDNVLYEPMKPLPRSLQASIASRIKIMGGLDIAEKRLPQDGRIRLKIAGRDYDVRLSTIPVSHGERLVLRLLPDS